MKNKSIREILYEAIICSLGPQLSIYTIIGVTVFQVRLNTIGGAFRGSGCIYVLFNGKVGKNALHASPPKHGSMRVSGPHVKDGFGAESLQFSHPPPSFPPHPANRNKPKNCRRRHYQNHIPIDLTAAASWPLFFSFSPLNLASGNFYTITTTSLDTIPHTRHVCQEERYVSPHMRQWPSDILITCRWAIGACSIRQDHRPCLQALLWPRPRPR